MGYYILTESGDSRVTEDGQIRVSEDYGLTYLASLSFSAVGTIVSSSKKGTTAFVSSIPKYFTRILEDGNTRSLESGDIRITEQIQSNQIVATLVGFTELTKFLGSIFIKFSDTWVSVSPNAKFQGVWKVATKMYRKIYGNWRRIY